MHQIRIFIYLIFAVCTLMLLGCSSVLPKDKATLHQSNVTNANFLTTPQGLRNEQVEDYYPIPHLNKQPPNTPVSIIPPGSILATTGEVPKRP